jgi:hypothetical protein
MTKKAWKVKNDKWEEIDDPLFLEKRICDESYGDDPRLEARLELLDYTSPARLIESTKIVVEIFPGRRIDSPYPYLALITIAGKHEVVYAANFPSLIELTRKLPGGFKVGH